MAISTQNVFLMKGTTAQSTTTWTKLVDIKDFPNLGGEPEQLETTTLSDKMRTYIPGIQSTEALTFNANYDETTYDALALLEGVEGDYAVWLGASETGGVVTPTGNDGKFSFKGKLNVYVAGGGVNEVISMVITITPSTIITKAA